MTTSTRCHDETRLLREILRTFGARPGVRLFRNSVGMVRLPGGGALQYGLCPGSADIVGWRTLPSPPLARLDAVAQFVAIEVKSARGRPTPSQEAFLSAVAAAGGLAVLARSIEDVASALGEPR